VFEGDILSDAPVPPAKSSRQYAIRAS